MDFEVEGSWNTEKECRPPWLADKKKFWILGAKMASNILTLVTVFQ